MFTQNIIKLLRVSTLKVIRNPNYKTGSNINSQFCMNYLHLSTNILHVNQNITDKLTEEQYLVKIKNDPDIFGDQSCQAEEYDEGDLKEEEFLQHPPDPKQQLRTKQYADMIKNYLHKKKIKEAIDVVEVRMIKQDRVKPEGYIYNLLLGGCGRVGYTKKAFALYNKMKQRGLVPTGGTYTALFNACANSPWKEDGLSRARHLREIMFEKRYEPNDTNYNAMIKAFGHCGDLETAFSLVDEMQKKRIFIKEDTFNFLLQACISDKEAGFRHALLVWRKFIKRRVNPNIYSYNLLLRCVRDCGLGNTEIAKNVIDTILPKNNLLESSEQLINKDDLIEDALSEIQDNKPKATFENRPNLIAKVPHLGNILSISEVTNAQDRLLLIGGCSGFLKSMQDNHCTPNIKTFTQLLDTIPSTLYAEKEILIMMRKLNVKPDIDFYNMLIRKRSMRFDYELAKEVLTMIKSAKLKLNIMTYGVLALTCNTKEEAEALIAEMENANYRLNAEILGTMLNQACQQCNFPYVLKIMNVCVESEIRPNQKFMECLEEFKKKCKQISNDSTNSKSKSSGFQKGFVVFKLRYKSWKEQVDPINADEIHPWQQFRQETKTNVKHYKDKEMSSRFKPRHISLYRQKQNHIELKKNRRNPVNKTVNMNNIKQINNT